MLEKEAISLFGEGDSRSEWRQALEKLKQFIVVDNDSIPHVLVCCG